MSRILPPISTGSLSV